MLPSPQPILPSPQPLRVPADAASHEGQALHPGLRSGREVDAGEFEKASRSERQGAAGVRCAAGSDGRYYRISS